MHQAIKRMNKHEMNSRSLNIKDHLKPVSTQPPLPLPSISLPVTYNNQYVQRCQQGSRVQRASG